MIDKVEKGLGLCSASNDTKYCWQCPYNYETHCIECLSQNALDILTKLKSENESLKAELGAAQQAINSMKSKLKAAGLYNN
jgi:hypothetical protein